MALFNFVYIILVLVDFLGFSGGSQIFKPLILLFYIC